MPLIVRDVSKMGKQEKESQDLSVGDPGFLFCFARAFDDLGDEFTREEAQDVKLQRVGKRDDYLLNTCCF